MRSLPRACLIGVVLLSGLIAGCPPGNLHLQPQSAPDALTYINRNIDRIAEPVTTRDALVTLEIKDAEGRTHLMLLQPAKLLFAAPRCLRFDIRHVSAGKVAEVGSNDARYWLALEVEDRQLWWGTWAALEAGQARRLALPPDQLLDALMMRPLPVALSGGVRAILRAPESGYERHLEYMKLSPEGWPYVARVVVLSPATDYYPAEIIDYDAAGEVRMHAWLSAYRPIRDTGSDGPRVPHEYQIHWPVDEARLRLSLRAVQYRPEGVPCDFPAGWVGPQTCLDGPPVDDSHGMDNETGAQ